MKNNNKKEMLDIKIKYKEWNKNIMLNYNNQNQTLLF